jgi:uncharacterized membrane protein YhaH (DUF805 family)
MHWYLDVLKQYAVFDGRARRQEYWMFILIHVIIVIVLSTIEGVIGLGGMLSTIYTLAVLVPNIAVAVRRLHDTSRSGWWVLIGFIPLIGLIVLIIFFVQDSTPGSNEYGPNPKGA